MFERDSMWSPGLKFSRRVKPLPRGSPSTMLPPWSCVSSSFRTYMSIVVLGGSISFWIFKTMFTFFLLWLGLIWCNFVMCLLGHDKIASLWSDFSLDLFESLEIHLLYNWIAMYVFWSICLLWQRTVCWSLEGVVHSGVFNLVVIFYTPMTEWGQDAYLYCCD